MKLDNVLNSLIHKGYTVTYGHDKGVIKIARKGVTCVRIKNPKEFTELEKTSVESLSFHIVNDLWQVIEIDRPNGQTLINELDKLDI